jgi:hypothetical protein
MSTDCTILAEIDAAFGGVERPEHFTNFTHCEECAEHDELLRMRDRDTLSICDVGNPGWDPICFCSPEGIAYYFPTLARLALSDLGPDRCDWYASQLLFHLYSGFTENGFFQYCSLPQRQAVARFIAYIIEAHASLIDLHSAADEFLRCHQLWSDAQPCGQRTLRIKPRKSGYLER